MGLPPYPRGGWLSNTVPPFPFASATKQVEIDLRENMQKFLEGNEYEPRRGHWVLLRRMDFKQHCTCWNETGIGKLNNIVDNGKYNEPKQDCPICHGEGYVYQDEFHLTRRVLVTPEIGMAGSQNITDIGFMTVNYIVFYFMYNVNPHKDDKIFEVVLDDSANPVMPIRHIEEYKIAVTEPYRDQGGRIEYWRAACKELVT